MNVEFISVSSTEEWILAEANKGWRVGPAQAERYRVKLAKLQERLIKEQGTRWESGIKWEINELELKLKYWVK